MKIISFTAVQNALKTFLLVTLGLTSVSETGFAWRETGHFSVCEIAYKRIQPITRSRIDKLFPGGTYPENCTWPDIVRKTPEFKFTAPWHFINRDEGEEYFDPKLVDLRGDVLQALLRAEKNLTKPTSTPKEQRFWLRILGHMTGDSHQPLHVGFRSNFGGNQVPQNDPFWYPGKKLTSSGFFPYADILKVHPPSATCDNPGETKNKATGECTFLRPSPKPINLHKVWDQHMLEEFIREKNLKPEVGDSKFLHKAYANAIERKSTSAESLSLKYSIYSDWVFESRALLPKVDDTNMGIDQYYKKNIDTVNLRIWQAGRRLAFVLDRIVGGLTDNSTRGKFMRKKLVELEKRMNSLREKAASNQ